MRGSAGGTLDGLFINSDLVLFLTEGGVIGINLVRPFDCILFMLTETGCPEKDFSFLKPDGDGGLVSKLLSGVP